MYDTEIDTRCGVCGMDEETIEHLLLECPHARKVWREVNIDIDVVTNSFDSVSAWVLSWFSNGSNTMDEKYLYTLMIGIWVLWKDRCDKIFQGVSLNHNSSALKINYHLHSHIHSYFNSDTVLQVNSIPRWIPPIEGVLKFNIDASYDPNTNELGTAVVVRDHTGCCKGIKGEYANGILSAEMGECMAIREALSWAKSMRCTCVQVEADAELVIQSINGVSLLIHWENRNLVKEIKELSLSFSNCSFTFTKRDNNQVADHISKKVRESANGLELVSDFTSAVCDLLAKDQANITS